MPYSRKEIIGLGFTSSAELLVEMGKCKALLDERAAATIKAMEAEKVVQDRYNTLSGALSYIQSAEADGHDLKELWKGELHKK